MKLDGFAAGIRWKIRKAFRQDAAKDEGSMGQKKIPT
jgi:hypothetical protein